MHQMSPRQKYVSCRKTAKCPKLVHHNLSMMIYIRDLSEIILNLRSEMRRPIPAMGVKFANPPLELRLKYHDPPSLV